MDTQTAKNLLAAKRYDEALTALGDYSVLSSSEEELGMAMVSLHGLGRWSELVALGEMAIKRSARPTPFLAARVHRHLGIAHLRLGKIRLAERHFRAAIHIATWDMDDPSIAVPTHRDIAIMYKNLGRWQQAKFENLNAMETADETQCHRESGGVRVNLAIVYLKSGEFGKVTELLDDAESFFRLADQPVLILNARLVRARYWNLMGRPKEALEVLAGAADELSIAGDLESMLYALSTWVTAT